MRTRMFQWLYDGTIGNVIAPKEETLCDKVQVLTPCVDNRQNAVSSGDVAGLDDAIRNGFDVVNYVEQGNGLIHLASYHGQLQILQRLLTQGRVDYSLPSRLFCEPAGSRWEHSAALRVL